MGDLDASSLSHKPEKRTNRVQRSLDGSMAPERSTGDDANAVQVQQSAADALVHGAHGVPAQSSTVSDIPLAFAAAVSHIPAGCSVCHATWGKSCGLA